MKTSQWPIRILAAVRDAGEVGLGLDKVIRIIDPSSGGKMPRHTGASIIGMSLMKLLTGGFLALSGKGDESIRQHIEKILSGLVRIPDGSTLAGHNFAALMRGKEQSFKLSLGRSFYAAQDVLDFSLTEAVMRSDRSVVCTPVFVKNELTICDVFAIMPFAEEFRTIYDGALAPAAKRAKMSCGRGDDSFGAHYVIDDIWTSILGAQYVIADCTNGNSNVFYELGIAHTLGKTTMIITQDRKWIPFDLKHWRYHLYEPSRRGISDLKEKVRQFLVLSSQTGTKKPLN
jgi:hypothetical protein